MRTLGRVLLVTVGGMAIATVFASSARANCADPIAIRQSGGAPTSPLPKFGGPGLFEPGGGGPDIVGLWHFTFSSVGNSAFGIPDGASLDTGYAQWHSDGTEIMNSSRDPATGNFCLGVYKSDGHRSYKLNHFAISWDNTGTFCTPPPTGVQTCLVGPTNIREEVTLDRDGDAYTGTVTIDQYDNAHHLMFELKGTISAHRVTVN